MTVTTNLEWCGLNIGHEIYFRSHAIDLGFVKIKNTILEMKKCRTLHKDKEIVEYAPIEKKVSYHDVVT